MNNPLLNFLYEHDIITKRGVNDALIKKMTVNKIIDMSSYLVDTTRLVHTNNNSHSIFDVYAATYLAGGREKCEGFECRLSRIDQLSRFSALYCDKLYVNNYFMFYTHSAHDKKYILSDALRMKFFEDVALISLASPLIENGIIEVFSPPVHLCPECAFELGITSETSKSMLKEYKKLEKTYFLNTTLSLEAFEEELFFRLNGPEPYYDHGGIDIVSPLVEGVRDFMPHLVSRLKKEKSVVLSLRDKKSLPFYKRFAKEAAMNLYYQLINSKMIKTTFLTDNPLHISMLRNITKSSEINRRNAIAFEHLNLFFPFIEDISIKDIMRVREREKEAFTNFRRAFNEAIAEFKTSNSEFTEENAKQLYSDVILPKLNILTRRTKQARRDLLAKTSRSLAASGILISFGLYFGLIPNELLKISKLLGLSKIAYDTLTSFLEITDNTKEIRNDDMYFLWKVSKKAI